VYVTHTLKSPKFRTFSGNILGNIKFSKCYHLALFFNFFALFYKFFIVSDLPLKKNDISARLRFVKGKATLGYRRPLTNCLAPIRFFCGGRSGKERSAFFFVTRKKYIKNKRLESHRRTKKDRQVGILATLQKKRLERLKMNEFEEYLMIVSIISLFSQNYHIIYKKS